MRKNRSAAIAAASFLLLAGAGIAAAPSASAGTPGGMHANDRNADFNGDGYEDVLVGLPGASPLGRDGAGLVTVQYGSSRGIGVNRVAIFGQSRAGIPGSGEVGDGFGTTLASGDLNADGYDDAIIGIPGEDLGTEKDAGGAVILWGSKAGLTGTGSVWVQSQNPMAGERFGTALAAARFSGDTPGDLLAVLDTRYLTLFKYDPVDQSGATAVKRTDTKRIGARAGAHDIAPKSLTTGDYDDNGYADLVVSGVGVGEEPGLGWSTYLAGGAQGLSEVRDLRGGPVAASGDIDGDGYDDLVTGEPTPPDDHGSEQPTGGVVAVHHGGPEGPGPGTKVQYWTQDSDGVPGVAERGDGWGSDLSVGDTNGDGYADVAIGAAGEDIGKVADAGAVWVLRGTAAGLTAKGAQSWDQDDAHVPGVPEKGDRWGAQVRLTDPDSDGHFGLLTAAPDENYGSGVVWVFSAGSGGVTANGSWTYGPSALGAGPTGAHFGAAIDE